MLIPSRYTVAKGAGPLQLPLYSPNSRNVTKIIEILAFGNLPASPKMEAILETYSFGLRHHILQKPIFDKDASASKSSDGNPSETLNFRRGWREYVRKSFRSGPPGIFDAAVPFQSVRRTHRNTPAGLTL